MNEKEILKKVKEGKPLTLAEERWRMIHILGYSPEQADRIIAITENKDPGRIID